MTQDNEHRAQKSQPLQLSERDTRHVVELLKNPPAPNTKLTTAAKAWAENQRRLSSLLCCNHEH